MRVEREDPPGVRAAKWAARWEWAERQTSYMVGREIARAVAGEHPWWALLNHRQACRARALLWRREEAHRERVAAAVHAAASAVYFDDDSDYRSGLLGVVQTLSPQHGLAIYNGTIGDLLFPEECDDE